MILDLLMIACGMVLVLAALIVLTVCKPAERSMRAVCALPLVASGGAGSAQHFVEAFRDADVDAALAASVFHSGAVAIPALKSVLHDNGIEVRRG